MQKTVVILGGGSCGISAAWKLVQNGFEAIVVEKESDVGGLCRTIKYKDFHFDLGGHVLVPKNLEPMEKITALLGNELLASTRKSVIKYVDKEIEYPLSLSNIIGKIPTSTLVGCLVDYLKSTLKRKFFTLKDASFEQWVVNRFGQGLYDLFFRPSAEKLWGVPTSEISSDWAAQRIFLMSLRDAIVHLFYTKEHSQRTHSRTFYYPKNGIGQIFSSIAEETRRGGGSIILDATVDKVVTEDNVVKSISICKDGKTEEINCDFVISTIPLTDFVISIYPPVQESMIMDSVRRLRFRSLRFMNILIDMQDISMNTWMYIPEKMLIMTRMQEPKRRSPYNAPEGKTSLILEIPCNFVDDVWNAPEDTIYARCLADLASLGIDIRGHVIDYFTTTAKHAYPVFSLDYKTHVSIILDYIGRYKNVMTCGRQGTFAYKFMDEAMEEGFNAAEAIERHPAILR